MARATRIALDLALAAAKSLKPGCEIAWHYAKVEMIPPMTQGFFHGPGGKKLEDAASKFANNFIAGLEGRIREIEAEKEREIKAKEAAIRAAHEKVKAQAKIKEEQRLKEEAEKKAQEAKKAKETTDKDEKKSAAAAKSDAKPAAKTEAKPVAKADAKKTKGIRSSIWNDISKIYIPAANEYKLLERIKEKGTHSQLAHKIRNVKDYYTLEMAPPNSNEIKKMHADLALAKEFIQSGCFKYLTVRQAWLLFLVCTEVGLWFFMGETIGKMSFVGYKV